MPKSLLEKKIDANYRALLKNDTAALVRMSDTYREIRQGLDVRIRELEAELTKKGKLSVSKTLSLTTARSLLDDVDREMQRLWSQARAEVLTGQERNVRMAQEHAQSIAVTMNTARVWNVLDPQVTKEFVGRLSNGSPLNQVIAAYGSEVAPTIQSELTRAVVLGVNPASLASRLSKQLDLSYYSTQRLLRTETLNTYRSVVIRSYKENSDIVVGWEWSSGFNFRTCPSCAALDGQRFPLSVTQQPTHVNCRCSSLPVFAGEGPLDRELASEWFRDQPTFEQDEMLGAAAGKAYRSGEVSLQDFVGLNFSSEWGYSYNTVSLAQARVNAASRTTIPRPGTR